MGVCGYVEGFWGVKPPGILLLQAPSRTGAFLVMLKPLKSKIGGSWVRVLL